MKQSRFFAVACLLAPIFYGACSAKKPNDPDGGGDDGLALPTGGKGNSSGSGSASSDGADDDDLDLTQEPPGEHCGDGIRDADEACDDSNQTAGDGCAQNCLFVEKGFICREAGTPCTPYALCGDGAVSFPEQCDDGGTAAGDGCSALCQFEIGYTCEGSPSACRETVCGDEVQEGAETCEAKDGLPFDGCSTICQGEPTCSDSGCTSKCGDGLIIGNEQCDDGNGITGDGCSADCQEEPGYTCTQAPPCVGPDCTLTLPIVFRDFDLTHPDFFPPYKDGDMDGHAAGIVKDRLDADGKPVYAASPTLSHVTSAASFGQWYTDNTRAIVGEITLYPNDKGGYVNRFGPNGEKYPASVKTPTEQAGYGTSKPTCDSTCTTRTHDSLQCENVCRPSHDAVDQRTRELDQATQQLENATDEDQQATLEAKIETLTAQIETAQAAADECDADCQTDFDTREAACQAQCAPCSSNPDQWCIGGEQIELDGNPLFFPIDDAPNPDLGKAKIPAQIYQGLGWPWEGGTEAASPSHNFHFTSEIAYWFEYTEGMEAAFEFIGDDDVFVFVNRRLLIDLGGIHVPLIGQFNLAANGSVTYRTWTPPDPGEGETANTPIANGMTTVADLGLEPGGVYEIKVFHAERKPEGSSFQITLSGFNTARSVCVPFCGDGVIAAGEQCDNGTENNNGGFNGCSSTCTLGTFCGDGLVQEADGEECDDADPNRPTGCAGCKIIRIY